MLLNKSVKIRVSSSWVHVSLNTIIPYYDYKFVDVSNLLGPTSFGHKSVGPKSMRSTLVSQARQGYARLVSFESVCQLT